MWWLVWLKRCVQADSDSWGSLDFLEAPNQQEDPWVVWILREGTDRGVGESAGCL